MVTTGVTSYVTAMVDACVRQEPPHAAHLHRSIPSTRPGLVLRLWCPGYYDPERQTRRVVVAVTDGVEELVGEGHSLLRRALAGQREPGDCGECREPEDFDWDLAHEPVNDAPVIACFQHGALAPGWMYDTDVKPGLLGWMSAEAPRGDGP